MNCMAETPPLMLLHAKRVSSARLINVIWKRDIRQNRGDPLICRGWDGRTKLDFDRIILTGNCMYWWKVLWHRINPSMLYTMYSCWFREALTLSHSGMVRIVAYHHPDRGWHIPKCEYLIRLLRPSCWKIVSQLKLFHNFFTKGGGM